MYVPLKFGLVKFGKTAKFQLHLPSIGGAKQKAADSFLAAFLFATPRRRSKRMRIVQWTILAKGRDGALVK
jgi:hypothetical protein